MLAIRLTRVGKKNKPQYRIVVQEKSKSISSDFLEKVGFYDPHDDSEKGLKLEAERIKYWISKGAEVSDTVHNILISKGVIEGKKIPKGRPVKKKDEEAEKKEGEAKAEAKPAEVKPEEKKEEVKPVEVKPEAPKEEKKEEAKVEAVKEEPKAEESKIEAPVEEKKEEVKL